MKTHLSGHKEDLIQVSYKHLYIFNWDIQSEQKNSVCMPHTLLERTIELIKAKIKKYRHITIHLAKTKSIDSIKNRGKYK
jgi:hypothetical protein